MSRGQHAAGGLLGDQEGTEGTDLDRAAHFLGVEIDQRASGAGAGIVDDDVGRAAFGLDRFEECRNILGIGGVAFVDGGAGLLRQGGELVGLTR